MPGTLKKSVRLISGTPRSRWVFLVVLALVGSVLEAAGALIIFGLFRLVQSPKSVHDLPMMGRLAAWFPDLTDKQLLVVVVLVMAAFFVVRAVFLLGQTYAQNRIAQNAGLALSLRLLRGYLALPYSFHVSRNSAESIRNTLPAVTDLLGSVVIPAIGIASDALVILAMGIVLLVSAPVPTLLTVLVLLPTVLLLLRAMQPRIRQVGAASQASYFEALKSLQQTFGGLRDIKLLGREPFFEEQFAFQRHRYARSQQTRSVMIESPRMVLEALLFLFILGSLLVVALRDSLNGDALAVVGLFGYAILRVLPSVNRTLANINAMRYGAAAVDDLYADLALVDALPDTQAPHQPAAPLPFTTAIRLEGVGHRYQGQEQFALQDVTATIGHGECIGIVGTTGAGKSTLVDLLTGLLPPTEGRIVVDGVDVAGDLRAWQMNLGVVPQQLFLLDDSLRRNIALGSHDEEIDEARVQEVLRLAQLDAFVGSLPEGLDTIVGEHGVRLSGGQRQRIAIARALYRDPSVLIFDEATSALDMMTEAQLVAALAGLRHSYTMVLVAHRLTTVRDCDRILLFEHGCLVAEGTYAELLEGSPAFRSLALASDGGDQA